MNSDQRTAGQIIRVGFWQGVGALVAGGLVLLVAASLVLLLPQPKVKPVASSDCGCGK